MRHALLVACLVPFMYAWAQEPRSSWSDVERVIAFGDVHGAADDLTQLLRSVGVVDEHLRWSAGSAHVVSLGDFLDRGAGSRDVMDLLMRLQQEAAAAGGTLHVLLGNHEALNLLGDLRYVTPGEISAYAADEPAGVRERMRDDWTARHGRGASDEFDQRFPPGYFGHLTAFSSDGLYGRWLLSLPVAIVIDDTLFMHGGPSEVLAGLSIEEINRRYRAALSEYLDALAALTAEGLIRFDDSFDERASLAQQRETEATAAAVRRFVAADRSDMLNAGGPNWYRGAALCREASESDVLEPLLVGLRAERLVIGHTVTHDGRVASRFDGAVIKLDTGMNREAYRGHPAALMLEGDAARVVYVDDGGSPKAVPAEPLYVTSPVLDESAVADILARGDVNIGARRGTGAIDVTVELEGRSVPASFVEARGDAIKKEVAAYRLDQLLRLGLVPATVKRELNGRGGFLQARPARWTSQAEVEARSLRPDGWCALPPQIEIMYAFDALIGNRARTRERILYDADWMLLLTGHDRAFGAATTLPQPSQAGPQPLGAEMRRRLAALDAAALERAVGEEVGQRERTALLARRDALLAESTATGSR